MKKTALICLFILLGALPVFAADSSSVIHEKQLQTKDSQVSHQNDASIIGSLKKLHSLFTQNEHLKKDIAKICSDMNKELVPRNRNPKTEIENARKNEIKTQYINSINQINDNSNQIKSLINQNDSFKKEIKNLEEIHETVQQGINSTKNEINSNSAEIKSLINQNNELMEKIQNIDENSTN